MDPFAEGEGPVMVAAAAAREISPPQRRSARRKLVQSTLFPHKSPELESTPDGEKDCDRGDEDRHEEECTGSQGKKKRRRKEKSTPQHKTPRKSPGEGTPKKSKQASPGEALVPAPIPSLRLEAKLLAEETSRIFAGKGIHPFFSIWKGGKKPNEEGTESNCCVPEKKEKRVAASIGPIHVFEKDQEDAVPLDWRNWQFCEGLSPRSSSYVKGRDPSVSEGSAELLGVDNVSSGLYPKGTSAFRDDGYFDLSCDTQDLCCQPIKDVETDSMVEKAGHISDCTGELDMKHQLSDLGQERIMSSYLASADMLEDSLWIDKYQPRNAMEVCGNDEPVKFLSEWLHNWHQGGSISKKSSGGDEYDMHDTDYSCLQNDSDSEDIHEGTGLKNVLLITGPVGSGKSAAIYACAKEQGFKVLEVNTSDCRNGAMVKQRFGEALDSHSLEWSRESQMESHSSQDMNFSIASGINQEFEDEVLEVIPVPDEDNCCRATERFWKLVCKDSEIACHRGPLKHLILFEDVDVTFAEDRGFIAAIQQIANKAKGPVILTSNSYDPVLPSNLDRLDLSFMIPSMKELLQHVNMVCFEEKVNIQPHMIEQLVDYCNGDIRKTIMHLQFWHQGGEVESPFSPLVFDPEIGHQKLPKMIPWGFPSHLSELVEKEISVSLSKMEELSSFVELNVEEFDSQAMQNSFKMDDSETGSVEAKKEAMLSRIFSDQDCEDFKTPFDVSCDFSDPTGTQVSFTRRNRRMLDVIMSSDSENQFVNGHLLASSDKGANSELDLEVDGCFTSDCPSMQNFICPSLDLQLYSGKKLEESCYNSSEMLPVKETCKSLDISCVPESSFVPETEINNVGDVLFDSQVTVDFEEVSVSNCSKRSPFPIEFDSPDKSIPPFYKISGWLASCCDTVGVSSHEEVGDSQNGHAVGVMREHQVMMDECSRFDFKRKFKVTENHGPSRGTNLVREKWTKLRNCPTDLRHLVDLEQTDASGILKVAYGMSNLISEAELLLSKCQNDDSFESTMALSEVTDARRWSDEQLQMTSAITHCGFGVYAKDVAGVELKLGANCKMDLIWDMPSTTNLTDIGRFYGQMLSSETQQTGLAGMRVSESGALLASESKPCFVDMLQSLVPSRLYLSVKGDLFHEYISYLSHISRSEASRLSEDIGQSKRRRRRARNYLSTGSLSLSPEEISLLGQSNVYGKTSSQSTDNFQRIFDIVIKEN